MAEETPTTTHTEQLRQLARRLLAEGKVSRVIGYRQGRGAHRVSPHFASSPQPCGELVLNPFCGQNLVRYLRGLKPEEGRVAVVVKGCDARAVNQLIAERQLQREQVYLIGVPCAGLVDPDKLAQRVPLAEVQQVRVEGEEAVVTTAAGEQRFAAAELLEEGCRCCAYPTPVVCDELLGEPVAARATPEEEAQFAELEALTPEQRLAYFRQAFERCLRCYACVRSCPMCYCATCFAQQTRPQYLPRTVGTEENQMFNLGRALHLAGRCVQCGACDRACPVQLPLRLLNATLAREVQRSYGHVAGLDPEAPPPLATFDSQDRDPAERG